MAQILSQDEVDALLQGLETEDMQIEAPSLQQEEVAGSPQTAKPTAREVRAYDFSHSEASFRGRLPGLEIIFSKFTRRLRNIFASELGKSADAGFDSMDVVLYEDLIKRLPLPSSIHLVRLEPLRGLGVFVIEARLAYAMIDIFFGGSGQRVTMVEGRDFTPIETNFLGKFVSKMLIGMEEAWQPVVQLTGHYLRSEVNPYLLGATAMGDTMVMATYKIDMAYATGDILFSFPFSAIDELRGRLKSPFPIPEGDTEETRARLHSHLLEVEVSLQAVVDVIELSIQEILSLRPGDLIQVDPQGMERTELWVEGKPAFCGRGAQNNGIKVFVVSKQYNA
jgi:flagellar motor switch protein FliM